jgi:aminopeptidase N
LPGHDTGGEAALSITADSLHVFNERYGAYPYTELDVVDAPMRNALGVEYPGIFLIASGLYEEPDQPSFAVATAHEVAHQWWYGVVGNDVFEEPWLDEALTTYSSSLYYQEVVGPGAYLGLVDYWQGRYDRLIQDGGDEPIAEDLSYFENATNPSSYGGVVYTKGALFFKALRDEIGDEAFFSALQGYYQEHKYQIARGDDLLDSFEEVTGKSLDGLFQDWLNSTEG